MYDIIIIGGGPGGYIAAERAGARGQKVLLIEKEHLGGVCLNWGCIPTKTLLNSAKTYAHALHGAQAFAFFVPQPGTGKSPMHGALSYKTGLYMLTSNALQTPIMDESFPSLFCIA